MNFRFYLEKLENSKDFKAFMNEHPDAYLCSGFFVLENREQQHLDYFVPSEKKLFSFQIEEGCKLSPLEFFGEIPEQIDECDFNFEEVERLIQEKMNQENLKKGVQKILLSLQSKEKKCFLICTIFISSLGLIKITIELPNMKIIDFEKKNFLDMIKFFGKKK